MKSLVGASLLAALCCIFTLFFLATPARGQTAVIYVQLYTVDPRMPNVKTYLAVEQLAANNNGRCSLGLTNLAEVSGSMYLPKGTGSVWQLTMDNAVTSSQWGWATTGGTPPEGRLLTPSGACELVTFQTYASDGTPIHNVTLVDPAVYRSSPMANSSEWTFYFKPTGYNKMGVALAMQEFTSQYSTNVWAWYLHPGDVYGNDMFFSLNKNYLMWNVETVSGNNIPTSDVELNNTQYTVPEIPPISNTFLSPFYGITGNIPAGVYGPLWLYATDVGVQRTTHRVYFDLSLNNSKAISNVLDPFFLSGWNYLSPVWLNVLGDGSVAIAQRAVDAHNGSVGLFALADNTTGNIIRTKYLTAGSGINAHQWRFGYTPSQGYYASLYNQVTGMYYHPNGTWFSDWTLSTLYTWDMHYSDPRTNACMAAIDSVWANSCPFSFTDVDVHCLIGGTNNPTWCNPDMTTTCGQILQTLLNCRTIKSELNVVSAAAFTAQANGLCSLDLPIMCRAMLFSDQDVRFYLSQLGRKTCLDNQLLNGNWISWWEPEAYAQSACSNPSIWTTSSSK